MPLLSSRERTMTQSRGFTLSELLVGVAILGIIATFTLSKLVTSVGEDIKIARYKQTIVSLMKILHDARVNGDLDEGSTNLQIREHFLKVANAREFCNSNAITQGCVGAGLQSYDWNPGYITHDGVGVVVATEVPSQIPATWGGGPKFRIRLDLDAAAGPNVYGEDVWYVICWTNNTNPKLVFRCFPDDSGLLDGTMWTKAFVGKEATPQQAYTFYQ
jgi:prepilin-type N-terminal cleavage/methylation domain-containing protein